MAPSDAPLIKGYLPVRIRIPNKDTGAKSENEDDDDSSSSKQQYQDTFMYIKEHQGGVASDDNDPTQQPQRQHKQQRCILFVANTPVIPGIQTSLLLKSIVGRFGEVVRVTVVPHPRVTKAGKLDTIALWSQRFVSPSCLPRMSRGKFAHVVLKSSKELKKTLKHLTRVMSYTDDDDDLPGIVLDPVELQTLADESDRQVRSEQRQLDGDKESGDDDSDEEHERHGLEAVHHRYQSSLAQARNRAALLKECNIVMQTWEETQEELCRARQAAASTPDDDGFVTVTYGHNEVQAELMAPGANKKRRGSKQMRNRSAKKAKKNTMGGAGPLQDFYRFQTKEHRKKTLHELRERFEQDLKKVKQLKEEKQYRPFG